ncbi:MAG: hydroxylamine reductase, partial [Thermodesulfobacteriota bacterium]|nr:hydroxylamine reductase [Thermodesulfobacteriota bacterium]
MFCYQCEQTAKGEGCTKIGVCGKEPEIAALQDLLIYALKGLSLYAVEGRKVGINDREVNVFTCKALFATLTNVNFDPNRLVQLIQRSVELREYLKEKVKAADENVNVTERPATFRPEATLQGLIKQGEDVGIKSDTTVEPDIHSLQQTLIYGIKGVAAYADHAHILGQEDNSVYTFIHEGLAATLKKDLSLDEWVGLVLKCGEINLLAMELLDAGNTKTYGHPVPTQVPLGAKKGKAILVSGHDLKDLEELLKQTEGKGIYVYTHGEMLSAHGYPGLKKYLHLHGHYGTAWQNQTREFAEFPGAILMTTNCIQQPKDSYKKNLFTCGMVGWPGVPHISDRDFTPIIEKALAMPGFSEDIAGQFVTGQSVIVGFGRNAVLGVADKVIEAVKSGTLRHFFLIAGCDGAKPGRNYYTEFVEKVPEDCVVLTLACGKFRFFDKDLGDIGGIPRLLDIGQCNDAYSAIQIAIALASAFNIGVNEL